MELAKLELNDSTKIIGSTTQAIFKFDNGYGASVVTSKGTYGVELAVLVFDESGSPHLTYDTPITGDVVGYIQDENELMQLLRDVQRLPQAPKYLTPRR